nr:RNA-directed DNA polymerase, eukaryota [Tanacetum cinerariifolium]
MLKKEIRSWVAVHKRQQSERLIVIQDKLSGIDNILDRGGVSDEILLSRLELMKQMQDIKSTVVRVMVDGEWVDEPNRVKEEFRSHFANRFQDTGRSSSRLNFRFPSRLTADQISELEKPVSSDEIRKAVWSCGENKSLRPDGFTFEFFRKFWDSIGPDICATVEWFFTHNSFSKGYNASFITLISKNQDPKSVSDFRPISLIGSLYKVVTKILAIRLSSVISDLISDVQTAFLSNRQILDGPFIINELLSWCRHKKRQAIMFKVDFAKAYDSVRWDYLDDVLTSFGFGVKWCFWIKGSLISGDPLASYLFILVMESLHLSVSRAVEAGIFIGDDRKISWVKWSKVLAFKKYGGLGVSSFYALNRALLFRWVWRFISHDNSLWFRFISAMHGSCIQTRSAFHCSNWMSIIREVFALKHQGIDFLSHCKRRVGLGMQTRFWKDLWLGDVPFNELFSRLYALENNKDCSVADKMQELIAETVAISESYSKTFDRVQLGFETSIRASTSAHRTGHAAMSS